MGSKHRLSNPGRVDLKIIEVQTGSYLGEDDIERFEDSYGRIGQINEDFCYGYNRFYRFHLCKKLIQKDCQVFGIDNFNPYYDPRLKKRDSKN